MVQIIQGLGSKLGTGIGQGLMDLANNRMGKIQQRELNQRTSQGLQALNFNPQEASALANLDPQILQNVVKQRLAAPNEANYLQALQSLLGGDQQTAQMPQGQQGLPHQQILNGQQQTPQGAQFQMGTRLPQGGINAQQATKLAELAQSQIAEKSKAQRHIESINAPILKQIQEEAAPARRVEKITNDLSKLLDTGKVITGLTGRLTPKELQTEEGQEFLSQLNQLVLEKAQLGKGVPTKLRLTLEQLSKPDVWQKPKTIKNLLDKIKNDPETKLLIAKDVAREQLEQEFGDAQPKNFKSLIEKRAKEIVSNQKSESNEFKELPPADQEDGVIYDDPSTGKSVQSINGKWVYID